MSNNTWTKGRSGNWLVRGDAGQSGSISVSKRDGSTSEATIARQVWTDGTIALYAVRQQAQQGRERMGSGHG